MNKVANKPVYPRVIYIYKNGITDCWVSEKDKNNLGKRLIKKYRNKKDVEILANTLKAKANEIFSFL